MTGSFVPAGGTATQSYYNRGEGFATYQGTSSAGGTDLAKLYDSATADDQFVAGPTNGAFLSGGVGTLASSALASGEGVAPAATRPRSSSGRPPASATSMPTPPAGTTPRSWTIPRGPTPSWPRRPTA